MIVSRCKQVSRLGFILLARLPTFAVTSFAFVRFTVTGIARKSHPRSHDGRRSLSARRALPRRYTGYSFVASIIACFRGRVNRFFEIFAFPFTRIFIPVSFLAVKKTRSVRAISRMPFFPLPFSNPLCSKNPMPVLPGMGFVSRIVKSLRSFAYYSTVIAAGLAVSKACSIAERMSP